MGFRRLRIACEENFQELSLHFLERIVPKRYFDDFEIIKTRAARKRVRPSQVSWINWVVSERNFYFLITSKGFKL